MEKTQQLSLIEAALSTLARRRNDQAAWCDLYECTRAYVLRVNLGVLGSAAYLAEDATQEVFVRLARYCTFTRFENPHAFLAYLRAICKNVSRSYIAKSRKLHERPLADIEDGGFSATPTDLHAAFALGEIEAIVLHKLASSSTDRTIFELWLRGNTVPEIASKAGVSYGNAAVKLHRLRRRIRDTQSITYKKSINYALGV